MTALSSVFLEHLETEYVPLKFAHDKIASACGVTYEATRNWLKRRCKPQVDNFGELLRNDPEFRAKVVAWIEGIEK